MGQVLESVLSYLAFKSEHKKEQNQIYYNQRIQEIQNTFNYSQQDVIQFFKNFRQIDRNQQGSISVDEFFDFIDEERSSIVSPFLERFFDLIQKENQNQLSFQEWLAAVSVFCLYTKIQVIQFAFTVYNNQAAQDQYISKKQIVKLFTQKSGDNFIYPYNYVKTVQLLEIDRSDRISQDDFIKIIEKFPYLCYPAFRLQQCFRQKIMGELFWTKQYNILYDIQIAEIKRQNNELYKQKLKEQKQENLDKKVKKFEDHMKNQTQNIYNSKTDSKLRDSLRRNSFNTIGQMPNNIKLKPKNNNSVLYKKKPIDYDYYQEKKQKRK